MPGFDGTGPRGMGPMTGGGRGFCSPWGIGAALRGGFVPPSPYAPYPFYRGYAPYGGAMPYGGSAPYGGVMPYGSSAPYGTPFSPQMTKEQELDFLRSEAQTIKERLEQVEARINELTAEG